MPVERRTIELDSPTYYDNLDTIFDKTKGFLKQKVKEGWIIESVQIKTGEPIKIGLMEVNK